MVSRGSPEYELAKRALGRAAGSVRDEHVRRINGRYLKIAYILRDQNGRCVIRGDEVVLVWKRYRIPKNHPWRGKRP